MITANEARKISFSVEKEYLDRKYYKLLDDVQKQIIAAANTGKYTATYSELVNSSESSFVAGKLEEAGFFVSLGEIEMFVYEINISWR